MRCNTIHAAWENRLQGYTRGVNLTNHHADHPGYTGRLWVD